MRLCGRISESGAELWPTESERNEAVRLESAERGGRGSELGGARALVDAGEAQESQFYGPTVLFQFTGEKMASRKN